MSDLWILASLAALAAALYSEVLRLWWTYDDVYVIHRLTVEPPFGYWLKSDAWNDPSSDVASGSVGALVRPPVETAARNPRVG